MCSLSCGFVVKYACIDTNPINVLVAKRSFLDNRFRECFLTTDQKEFLSRDCSVFMKE